MNWRLFLGSKSAVRQTCVVQTLDRKKCLVLREGGWMRTQPGCRDMIELGEEHNIDNLMLYTA